MENHLFLLFIIKKVLEIIKSAKKKFKKTELIFSSF